MIFVNVSEQAAIGDVNIPDRSECGSGADDGDVFAEVVAVAHVGDGVLFAGDGVGQLHAIAQSFQIVHAEGGAPAGFEPFLLVGDNADAVNHESIGAEVGHFVADVNVESVQDGDDGDEG